MRDLFTSIHNDQRVTKVHWPHKPQRLCLFGDAICRDMPKHSVTLCWQRFGLLDSGRYQPANLPVSVDERLDYALIYYCNGRNWRSKQCWAANIQGSYRPTPWWMIRQIINNWKYRLLDLQWFSLSEVLIANLVLMIILTGSWNHS